MKVKRRRTRNGTLAHLTELWFKGGHNKALALLRATPGYEDALLPFKRLRTGEGKTESTAFGGLLTYENMSPPSLWGTPYAVLKVAIPHNPPTGLMSRVAEHIVIPEQNSNARIHVEAQLPTTNYPGLALTPLLPTPLIPGELARVNTSLPHQWWNESEETHAWMIIEDEARSAAKVLCTPPRIVAPDYFIENRPAYALTAFGVSERIKNARLRAGLTMKEVADQCRMDRAFLSKIENGKVNVTFNAIRTIGERLGCNPFAAFDYELWTAKRDTLTTPAGTIRYQGIDAPGNNYLHTRTSTVAKGDTRAIPAQRAALDTHSSIIMLKGRAVIDMNLFEGAQTKGEYLEQGEVLHLRSPTSYTIRAINDTHLCEVMRSPFYPEH